MTFQLTYDQAIRIRELIESEATFLRSCDDHPEKEADIAYLIELDYAILKQIKEQSSNQ